MPLSLKSIKTNTLAVIIPHILLHLFAMALHAIEMQPSKAGNNVITAACNESRSKEKHSIRVLSNGSVDGFIMSIAEESQKKDLTEHVEVLLKQNIPIVLFDRVADHITCDKVIIDDFGAAYEATKHLLGEGRK